MGRIKFYSVRDMAVGYNLKNIESILKKYNNKILKYNINDIDINNIIECYNIKQYFDSGLKLNSWNVEQINFFNSVIKKFYDIIEKFWSLINNDSIIGEYLKIDIEYREDFWKMFSQYKKYKHISNHVFKQLLKLKEVNIYSVLYDQQIVKYYGNVIKEYLIADSSMAKIILDKYEMKNNNENIIYLPSELTNSEKEELISKYIDLPIAHINMLEIIQNIKPSKELRLSDKVKLKAKRKIEEEKCKLFNKNSGIYMETDVCFSNNQCEARSIDIKGNNWKFSYSTKWITENSDFNTLLNNFIYVFEFVDMQMRVKFVSKKSELSVFGNIFIRSKHDYPVGVVFNRKNLLALMQISAYYKELQRIGIRFEDSIEWFFKTYLKNEFGINGFTLKMPSEKATYLEKARSTFPELESILKQYKLYVQNGEIDNELLEMSSRGEDYGNLTSLVDKKYVYGKGDIYKKIKYFLSSDQCMLCYIRRIEDRYNCFFDLVNNEEIYMKDYQEYQNNDLQWLIEHEIIEVDLYYRIKWKNPNIVLILYDLSVNDVISYWSYPLEFRKYFDELEKKGFIEYSNKLFTLPEQEYISFILNKKKFNNGYDIRNKCEHGTQANSETKEKIHEQYYMYALLIFVICIIKINDDVCTYDLIENDCT
ncbi:hypothetical protein SAMN02745134_00232 [Clostridium acidisoli DSM 12555]|uniref:Uncharacterized protein n=1 Tax=Clostridium acidisoli DSM 12555 TaxID=1121291 RepID=A0A1W1WZN8_9CLOT|nr:hypothetical protein [Clostridium acidisoli]SMC17087.1 hypothetical protein SAMN02745134_00232 [Clostridium acidisoli DSM 12555]